jgi:RNA polymerase sigma factor (sigma-70 family)
MPTDPASWIEPVLERYERPLISYAASIAGDAEAARDIVQETLLRLARNGPVEPPKRLAAWLFTVCRNRAIDWKRKADRLVTMEAEPHHLPSEEPGPSARLEAKESAFQLGQVLARLPEQQREVLRLRFQCDLSYREIAEVMQLGEGNVGFLIHTGIKTLRQLWPKPLEVTP